MSELLKKHLDAIAATMQIGLAQVEAARHALLAPATTTQVPAMTVVRPERCKGVTECALHDDDARIDTSSLAGKSWKCRGCGHLETAAPM